MWQRCPDCDRDLLVKTSTTYENPNRPFVSCSEDFGGCGFWSWVDRNFFVDQMASYAPGMHPGYGGYAPTLPQRHARWQGDLTCPGCGKPLKVGTGGPQSKNPGREYVSCSNFKNATGCGFFNFTDEDIRYQPKRKEPEAPTQQYAAAVPDATAIALADINAKLDQLLAIVGGSRHPSPAK